MKEKIEKRLKELQEELAGGQKVLAEIDAKRNQLVNNLVKISGAIQEYTSLLKIEKEGEIK